MPDTPNLADERFRQALQKRAEHLRIDPRVKVRFDAEELVGETYSRVYAAHKRGTQFRGTTDGEAFHYLFGYQTQALIDWHRKHLDNQKESVKREQNLEGPLLAALNDSLPPGVAGLPDGGRSPSSVAAGNEELQWLTTAIAGLPQRQREAMTLRFRHGLSVAEVADRMSETAEAVAGLIYRATLRLKEMRPGDAGGEDDR